MPSAGCQAGCKGSFVRKDGGKERASLKLDAFDSFRATCSPDGKTSPRQGAKAWRGGLLTGEAMGVQGAGQGGRWAVQWRVGLWGAWQRPSVPESVQSPGGRDGLGGQPSSPTTPLRPGTEAPLECFLVEIPRKRLEMCCRGHEMRVCCPGSGGFRCQPWTMDSPSCNKLVLCVCSELVRRS